MIYDHLKNSAAYTACHPLFPQAFAFIERACREDLPIGRYEINGDRLFAMVQEYDTKEPSACRFEGHRRYIDVQYMVSGIEGMGVMEVSCAETETEYNVEKDVAFFAPAEDATLLAVKGGEFALFYPHDVHRPGMAMGTPAPVRKIVVKIAVDL